MGGDLLLTAPPDTPQQAIYHFLETNRDRIGRQVMDARRKAEALPQPEEDLFLWLGEPFPVIRRVGNRSQARLRSGRVSLSLAPGDWPHEALERLRQRLSAPFLTQLALQRAGGALGLALLLSLYVPNVQPLWFLSARQPSPLPEQLSDPHASGGHSRRH